MSDVTITLTGAQARKKVRGGVKKVYDAVRRTLGPEGRNALLPRTFNRGPRITNDGITVIELARQLKDDHERLAAEAFAEGSKRTNELAGDGTTATSVIAGSLYMELVDQIPSEEIPAAGISTHRGVRALRKEMKDAKDVVIKLIKEMATPIETLEDLKKIAVVSIGKEDNAVSDKVAELVWSVGRDANGDFVDNHVDVVEGYKGEVEIERTEGMRFPSKLASKAFINRPDRFEMIGEDVAVFVTNYNLDNPHDLVPILEKALKAGHTKIALFAPQYSAIVIKSLIATTQNGLFCYPVLSPALRTEQLEDLAAYTDAKVVDKDKMKLSQFDPTYLGKADKIVVKDTEIREDAVLLGGRGAGSERIAERIKTLKGQVVEAKTDLSRISLEKRIANLAAAVGVVRVGASTNAELLYLKLKIEDGVNACKAALQEGYVLGGGLCLKVIADQMTETVLSNALRAPYMQIQTNAGGVVEIGDDIIDPAKVIRLEVEHAVSIASSLITTDIIIADVGDRPVFDGYEVVAKAIGKIAYYDAKHKGLIKESEDEAEADREKLFEQAMFEAND